MCSNIYNLETSQFNITLCETSRRYIFTVVYNDNLDSKCRTMIVKILIGILFFSSVMNIMEAICILPLISNELFTYRRYVTTALKYTLHRLASDLFFLRS